MARPRKNSSADNKTFGGYEFVNVDFSEAMRAAFLVWYKPGQAYLSDMLYTCTEAGSKVSFSQNTDNGVYRLSITVKDAGKSDSGVVYQIQHTDMSKLVALGLWAWNEVITEGHIKLNADQFDW